MRARDVKEIPEHLKSLKEQIRAELKRNPDITTADLYRKLFRHTNWTELHRLLIEINKEDSNANS